MSHQSMSWSLSTRWLVVATLAVFFAAVPALPQGTSADYMFLVGSGFLCDPADSSPCPAVVKSAQGDMYETSGAGTFNTQSKSVTATGTFTHRSSNGNALETGIWIATEPVSFNSYGIAPAALMQRGLLFGPPQFGPRRLPMLSGSMPAGGLAVLRIQFLPMWAPPRTATLQVNCALGRVPDDRQTEGIRLTIDGGGGEFDEEVSGHTLFVLMRPGASVAPRVQSPVPRSDPNLAPPEAKP